MEIWKDIPGHDKHMVSNHGRVKNKGYWGRKGPGDYYYPEYIYNSSNDKDGYQLVSLFGKTYKVHRLVALAFLGEPKDKSMMVCHNDNNKSNNHVNNLRWDTASGNMLDKVKHGTHHEVNKSHCPVGHKLEGNNLEAWGLKRGKRKCRSCSNGRRRVTHHGGDFLIEANTYYERYMHEST